MTRYLTYVLLILLVPICAQAQNNFVKTYYPLTGGEMEKNIDGTYSVMCIKNLLRLDASGNLISYKTGTIDSTDMMIDLENTSDSGHVILGRMLNHFGSQVIKVDKNDNFIWCKRYYSSSNPNITFTPKSIVSASGNLILGANDNNPAVVKLNSNGNVLLAKHIMVYSMYMTGLMMSSQGSIIGWGSINSYPAASPIFLFKMDTANLNVAWMKSYVIGSMITNGIDDIQMAISTSDNGIAAAGITNNNTANSQDGFVIRTDNAGNVKWCKMIHYLDNISFFDLFETTDKGLIVTGYVTYNDNRFSDFACLKLDSLGNMEWFHSMGFLNISESFKAIVKDDPNHLVAMGTYGSGGSVVTRMDYTGSVFCTYDTVPAQVTSSQAVGSSVTASTSTFTPFSYPSTVTYSTGTLSVDTICYNVSAPDITGNRSAFLYPNPSQGELYLSGDASPGEYRVEIYNSLGALTAAVTASPRQRLETGKLGEGIYCYKICSVNNPRVITGKLIIIKP